MSGPHEDVEKENTRLRKEVRLLREEREVLKKAAVGSTGQRNIFYLRCSERTYDGTNQSPWLVTRAEG
jgi:transposase-like protein